MDDIATIVVSALILGGVGLVFGTLIALAFRKLRVWEDPRIDGTVALLPGANCGACGYPGCRAFAEKLVAGAVQPAGCNVLSGDGIEEVAAYLGVAAGAAQKKVARLLCAGGSDVALQQAEYRGLPTCGAAAAVAGGGKACKWGCIGLGDCETACNFGAIHMSETGLPLVDPARCTACGDCVAACPKNLFVVMPIEHKLIVQCRSLLEGEVAEKLCAVACTGCGRCAADARPGVIRIVDGLARVDYEKNDLAGREAIARCPTKAIVWVEGAQFPALSRLAPARSR